MKKEIYEYLDIMCCSAFVRNEKSSYLGSENISNRAKTICQFLGEINVSYNVDRFIFYDFGFFYNIEVMFKAKKETDDTLVFIAHHDVANVTSENCQDNTASVVNLINLCNRIKDKELDKNILVVFTDSEEFGGKGAAQLSKKIRNNCFGNVLTVVNSELTGLGNSIWVERKGYLGEYLTNKLESNYKVGINEVNIKEKRTPFNDSYVLRDNGINSICFGILPEEEVMSNFPETWRLCHSVKDLFINSNKEDMERYVDFLESLI